MKVWAEGGTSKRTDDYIVGDTFARNETTGKDEYFQFIVPKGKVVSENTITLEAEGDPSVNKVLDMYINAEVKAA